MIFLDAISADFLVACSDTTRVMTSLKGFLDNVDPPVEEVPLGPLLDTAHARQPPLAKVERVGAVAALVVQYSCVHASLLETNLDGKSSRITDTIRQHLKLQPIVVAHLMHAAIAIINHHAALVRMSSVVSIFATSLRQSCAMGTSQRRFPTTARMAGRSEHCVQCSVS